MPAVMFTTFYRDAVLGVQQRKMPRLMASIATAYANKVKSLMRDSPATGRLYRRDKVGHRASAPGEPPAPDTGALLGSIRWQVRSDDGGSFWAAEVGSNLPYALYLEYGAARGVVGKGTGRSDGTPSRIEAVQWVLFPRPAWGPALRFMYYRTQEIVAKESRR